MAFIGFCTHCRNKVREEYAELVADQLIHIAKVNVRYADNRYTSEVCNGVIEPGTLAEAFDMQREAGFQIRYLPWKRVTSQRPVDYRGRQPHIDRSDQPAPIGDGLFIKPLKHKR